MDLETFITMYEPFKSAATRRIYLRLHFEDEYGEDVTEEVLLTDKRALKVIKYEQAKMLGRMPRSAETEEFLEVIAGAAEMSARREAMDDEPAESEQAEWSYQSWDRWSSISPRNGGLTANNGHLLSVVTKVATKMGILEDDPKFPKTVD